MILLSRLLKQMSDMNKPTASFTVTAEGTQAQGTDAVQEMFSNIFGGKNKEEKKVDNAENVEDAEIIEDNN